MVNDVVSLDKESAESELNKLCKSWFVDLEDVDKSSKETLIKKIMNGNLIISHEEGWKSTVRHNLLRPLNTDGDKNHLIYKFTTAGDMIALDGFDETQNYGKIIALISAISKTDKGLVGRMVCQDLMVGQAVGGLFLAV